MIRSIIGISRQNVSVQRQRVDTGLHKERVYAMLNLSNDQIFITDGYAMMQRTSDDHSEADFWNDIQKRRCSPLHVRIYPFNGLLGRYGDLSMVTNTCRKRCTS